MMKSRKNTKSKTMLYRKSSFQDPPVKMDIDDYSPKSFKNLDFYSSIWFIRHVEKELEKMLGFNNIRVQSVTLLYMTLDEKAERLVDLYYDVQGEQDSE